MTLRVKSPVVRRQRVCGFSRINRLAERGVTLVELMVSLVIGMLVLSGVTYVFFASRQTYGYNETMSRIQENARIALDALSFDIRMAGFFGCGDPQLIPVFVIADPKPIDKIDETIAVTGYTYGDAAVAFVDSVDAAGKALKGVAGSSIIVIRRGSSKPMNIVQPLPNPTNPIKIGGNPDKIMQNDPVLVTDCSTGDLFRVSDKPGVDKDGKVNLSHGAGVNVRPGLSKVYGLDAQVMRFEEMAFFLRDSGRTTSDGRPITSLFRSVNGAVGEEIVDGIVDMRIFYGLDVDNDKSVDEFKKKEDILNWNLVRAVRVHLFVSTGERTLTEPQPYQFAGGEFVKPGDTIMRREFSQTIALRNRLTGPVK